MSDSCRCIDATWMSVGRNRSDWLRCRRACAEGVSMARNSTWALYAATSLLMSASVQASQSLLEVVGSCRSQADDAARLQCYDRVVAQFTAATTVATNTAKATDEFGLTSAQILARQPDEAWSHHPLKRITARVATVAQRSGARLVLHLDNGQVWEPSEDAPDLHLEPGDFVTIDRGVLGAYYLSVQSQKQGIKVQRTQ
jgi:hypothetical protein